MTSAAFAWTGKSFDMSSNTRAPSARARTPATSPPNAKNGSRLPAAAAASRARAAPSRLAASECCRGERFFSVVRRSRAWSMPMTTLSALPVV